MSISENRMLANTSQSKADKQIRERRKNSNASLNPITRIGPPFGNLFKNSIGKVIDSRLMNLMIGCRLMYILFNDQCFC